MKRRTLRWVATSAIVAAAIAAAPSAALAAGPYTMPTDQSVYIIDQAGRGVFETKSDGASTKLDVQVGFTDIQTGAYNPVDKKIYIVDNVTFRLGSIDLTGGSFTDIGEVTYGSHSLENAYGLVVKTDGSGRFLGYDNDESNWGVWDLDLTTGVLTNPVWLNGATFDDPYGYAIDPVTGKEYFDTDDDTIVEFNPVSGLVSAAVGTLASNPDGYPLWDGKFDTNGVLWVMLADCCAGEYSGELYSWKAGDANLTLQGVANTGSIEPSGPVVVGLSTAAIKGTLPDTGASVMLFGALSVSGVALVGLGFAGVIVARRRKA
ncbi:unannotated protein [freshwater metagenome]|uniref:Unannotated protein n=1 Tax=freshwater metagenome TaxID=449393 RepID=A0A6J6EF50_9ZZZZ|nr:hypothetical protein [Actinomycetota bacterium]